MTFSSLFRFAIYFKIEFSVDFSTWTFGILDQLERGSDHAYCEQPEETFSVHGEEIKARFVKFTAFTYRNNPTLKYFHINV